jgi:parallel beta-helix repeat protein
MYFGQGYQSQIACFISIEGLVMDGSAIEYECVKISDGAHHIQLKDCEIRNAPQVGVLEKHSPGDNRYIQLDVHDNGRTDNDHGISLGGSNDVIENCDVYRNAGWGIHIYDDATPCNGTMVRNNRVHDNVRTGTRGAGIGLYSGHGHAAINNVVWNNAIGICLDSGAADTHVFFNTVCKNREDGIVIGGACALENQICNNVVCGNGGFGVQVYALKAVVVSGNILHGNRSMDRAAESQTAIADAHGAALSSQNRIGEAPLFADELKYDFHLKAGSSAVGSARFATGVTNDCEGRLRSKDAPCAGAFEFISPPGR